MNATHRVLLLRAGETDWDLAGRVQGRTDLPLSAPGRVAVGESINRLGRPPLAAVLSADDEASRETAELLGAAARVKPAVVADLCECSLGLWEGVQKSELGERFCRAGKLWSENPCCVTPPEGEAFEEFADRLLKGLRRALLKIRSRGRRSNLGVPAVGLVLRPISDALVRCWLTGAPVGDMGSILKERPGAMWLDADVEAEWSLPLRATVARPGAASAA
ncbi:MAG: histidine phosphatase family protein [Phycisphaerales bacterium]|nr:histidine phosphatase family protein [Phycisphaerales bacterium]